MSCLFSQMACCFKCYKEEGCLWFSSPSLLIIPPHSPLFTLLLISLKMSAPPYEQYIDGMIAEAAGLLPARKQVGVFPCFGCEDYT